ncbi:S26 family signal peptidase [Mesorhizobium sp.]|uniref:S26 family signal peptidase n=1 Tax=Mesorhizobium sp. TaxID=1871066 RepID=UPI000FE55D6F|nr:S26 family signal peptidase [Mesorhizobium sp.]RWI72211.1 MAG: S26 family signal peptidase [Mesorhizobium sp.]
MTRLGLVTVTTLAAIGVGYSGLAPMPTKLIWNASASAPVGLYSVVPADQPEVPELVAVEPPGLLAAFLAARGYLPEGVALMKRVRAVAGQTVCRTGLAVTVDGIEVGAALERDRVGRDLPVWQGCKCVPSGAVFLMNWQVGDSLDGRYFGLTPISQIIGRAVPLWTDEDGDGRFVWRAPTH